jgi:hypothetical protein
MKGRIMARLCSARNDGPAGEYLKVTESVQLPQLSPMSRAVQCPHTATASTVHRADYCKQHTAAREGKMRST